MDRTQTANSADRKSEYRQGVSKMGKKEYTLRKMQEFGFWPRDLPTPYERQKNESPEDYALRKALLKEYDKLAGEIARAYEDKKEIAARLKNIAREYDQTWDDERIRRDVARELLRESLERRAARKRLREEQKRQASLAWDNKRAENIVFIGKGYSGGLCHRETDEEKLLAQGLPVIRDDKELATFLGIEYRELRFLTYHRDVADVDHYHRYTVPKRNGGLRSISAPKPLLKNVQRIILSGLLEKLAVSPAAHGFVRGRSVVSGAQSHPPSPALLVNLDVENFFPTITFPRVRGLFQSFGYSGYVASLLAMLCTDCERMPIEVRGQTKYVKTGERALPQGSPASPLLTNLLCRHLDKCIGEAAQQYRFTYSRYADDISLAFADMPEEQELREAVYRVIRVIENEGFRINQRKTRYLRGNNRQIITGVVVNGPEPGVPKAWVRRLRAAIHNASVLAERGNLSRETVNEISGMVAWLRSVNPERYRKIIAQAENLF